MFIVFMIKHLHNQAGLALKNPPKKTHPKKPKKTRLKKPTRKLVFLGFFERSLCFVNKFTVFPFKRPLNHK
jgi:hypothetical protein